MASSYTTHTQPAFIYYGTWDDTTRSHPAMKWMEDYTKATDQRIWNSNPEAHKDWLTPDFKYYKADGSVVSGAEKAWTEGIPATYAVFKEYQHEPNFLICWETKDGWEMIGQASLFMTFPGDGDGPGGVEKVKDLNGKEWDAVTPGGFHFDYVKDESAKNGGILLRRCHIFADSGPGMMVMIKKGLIKAQDLGL
jgi:hypothetical protein